MPFVQIEIREGRTLDQKRAMVKEVSEALKNTIDCQPQSIKIVIREMKRENFATNDTLDCDVEL